MNQLYFSADARVTGWSVVTAQGRIWALSRFRWSSKLWGLHRENMQELEQVMRKPNKEFSRDWMKLWRHCSWKIGPMYLHLSVYHCNGNCYHLLTEKVLGVYVQSLWNAELKHRHMKYWRGVCRACRVYASLAIKSLLEMTQVRREQISILEV